MAHDFAAAREAIQELGEQEYSARGCAIMAAIARGEGEPDAVVRGWLARALGASRADASDSEIGHAAMLPLLIGDTDTEDAEEGAARSGNAGPDAPRGARPAEETA